MATAKDTRINVRAICFDIGDTLLFDTPTRKERIAAAITQAGIQFDNATFATAYYEVELRGLKLYMDGIDIDQPHYVFELTAVLLEKLCVPSVKEYVSKIVQSYANIACNRYVHADAKELLGNLKKRGFKLCVISDWDTSLPELLEEHQIGQYFDSISVSAIVGATKPNKKIFNDAISKLGVDSSEILHIGDYYELDVLGSRNAGTLSLLFDSQGRYTNTNLDVPKVSTFDQLTAYLERVELSQ